MNKELSNQSGSLISPAPRHKRWRLIFLCLCIFICGGFTGSVVTKIVMWPYGHGPGPGDIEERAHDVVSHMRNDFDLTEEQAKQIYAITKERFTALEDVLHQNLDAMDLEIRTVLDDKQIIKFDEWINKKRKEFPPPPRKNMRRGDK